MIEQISKIFKDLALHGLEKMGLYYSTYRGYVYSREDPKGMSRLMLYVPEVFGDMVLDKWAWPSSNYSGKGYGAQAIPLENDLVWVQFEKGNPKKPLWSYGYFGKDEKPEELKDPNLYWFRTPKGLQILLDDNTKSTRFTTPAGYIIEMDQENEYLKLMKKEGFEIIIDNEGIKIDGEELIIRGGGEGGIAISGKLAEKYNNLESEVNTLKNLFLTWIPVPTDGGAALKTTLSTWASQPMSPTTEQEISNDKVKHG